MEGEDAEAFIKAIDDLAQSAHKLAEAMYAKAPDSAGESRGVAVAAGAPQPKDDNVVDADFDEVKSDKK